MSHMHMKQPESWRTLLQQVGRYRVDETVTQETRIDIRDIYAIRKGRLAAPKRQKQRDALSRMWWELYGADAGRSLNYSAMKEQWNMESNLMSEPVTFIDPLRECEAEEWECR